MDIAATNILPPPFEWINIPGGKVTLEIGDERPVYTVKPFVISKYPITNAQFQIFVEAPDGYRETKWWDYSPDAKRWRSENLIVKDTVFEGDDLPRTRVTWYEAVAFCRWLGEQIGERIILPTEQQWQRAAQGDDGREYPWSNKFDKSLCNTDESGVKQTTPVTQYPGGASPYGVMDMSGNVVEWCLNEYHSPEKVQLSGERLRVLRGGSFMLGSYFARCAFRYPNAQIIAYPGGGFRVCIR